MPIAGEEILSLAADGDSGPFSDTAFVRHIQARVALYALIRTGQKALRERVLERGEASARTFAGHRRVLDALQATIARLDAARGRRVKNTGRIIGLPRLLRVCKKLGLSEREGMAIEYMVVHYTGLGAVGCGHLAVSDDLVEAGDFAGLGPVELAELVNPARPHMTQGLFELDRRLTTSYFKSDFSMSPEVVKALAGGALNVEEYLKIDKTAVAEVLAEEPGFDIGAMSILAQVRPGGAEPAEEEPEPAGQRAPSPESDSGKDDAAGEAGPPAEAVQPGQTGAVPARTSDTFAGLGALEPYTNDLQYLDDYFRLITTLLKLKKLKTDGESYRSMSEPSKDAEGRELGALERMQRGICERRLEMTRAGGGWLPRLERLVDTRGLVPFEKLVLITLVGAHISADIMQELGGRYRLGLHVADLIQLLLDGLQEQISHRRYFYRSGTLVKEGMVSIDTDITNELESCNIDIDRRMLDYIVGLDVEATELVEGGHLYTPRVKLDQVVLPREMKDLILGRVEHFAAFGRARRDLGFEETISYGKSLVMLFFGPSGTGKTMMANALANHLGKKVFLINFPSLGGIAAGAVLRYIFREAKIQDAIVFFDECEELFKGRGEGNASISTLLTEIERHDGMVIMATNRPFELDEAMHRRITLALEFRNPDLHLREQIWKNHLPPAVRLAEDVSFAALASGFELSGGFIKNAVLTALSLAVERDGSSPVICMADLEKGARLQLRSRLRLADFDRRVVPTLGLEALVLPPEIRQRLIEVVSFEKAREVLFGQWGFDAHMSYGLGMTVLFHGRPGTGKSFAAEALGYEIGRPLMVVNCAELISKYVGDTPKNLDNLFKEARQNECIMVFDEADGLFAARTAVSDATDRYANVDVGVLLYHIERYPGVVILTTNLVDNVDEAFFRRMKHVLEFPMPDAGLREMLWKKLIPPKTPLANDIDYAGLAKRFDLSGGNIKNAIFRAAARAALRPGDDRMITASDLVAAAEEEVAKERKPGIGF
jgi:SpoVK/Ycf46/Vps4 family AAA+-type ATPase